MSDDRPSRRPASQGSIDARAYDDTGWPIVRVRPPPPGSAPDAFRRHLENINRAFAREAVFALLVDTRARPPLNATERRMVADRIRQNQEASGGLLKAIAVIIVSPVGRGIFTAIRWLARPPYPMAAFDGEPEAMAWLRTFVAPSVRRGDPE